MSPLYQDDMNVTICVISEWLQCHPEACLRHSDDGSDDMIAILPHA